ncbi:hypothetical protein KOW79_010968 [Hemibagrus wyckioides]|uniref:Uncharacterized protein n=1 Tax=Hemibagrus wyckioides TaxID=337641 RepID=A0A9D3SNP7_9TELE|nr:hypothetical protein KOW79_010968 [Hemibagrus wyckioides]
MKNTAEAVIIPLKGGISSLNEVYQALIEADVDPVTGKCSNYDYIRQQIVQSHQFLEQSEQAASSGLQSLDENIWMKSPAMIISGEAELDQAQYAVDVAQQEVKNSENEVRKYEYKVSYYESRISQTEHDLSQKDEELKHKHEETQKVRKQIESVAKFQEKEPVMKVMEDVMKAIEQITGNELLYSNDLPRLINQMKENNRRLAALCASENNPWDRY